MNVGRVRLCCVVALALVGCPKRHAGLPTLGPPAAGASVLPHALPRHPAGEVHRFGDDRGQVVLIDVWATWCEPCRDALPVYEQLAKHYGDKGLRVYAVSVDADPAAVSTFVTETKLSLPVLLDKDASFAEQVLKVRVMPTSFLVDRRGSIRYVHEGFAEEFLGKYQTELEELLAERGE